MSKKSDTHRTAAEAGGDRANLDRQYRSIGISAVAAALPFVDKTKNSRHASAAQSEDKQSPGGRRRSVLAI